MIVPGSPVSQTLWAATILPAVIAALVTALVVAGGGLWLASRMQKRQREAAWQREKEDLQAQYQRDFADMHDRYCDDLEQIHARFQEDLEKLRGEVKDDLAKEREMVVRELLDEIWKSLVKAYSSARNITEPWRDYPDLNTWDESQIEEFIKTLKFSDHDKQQLRNAEDKTRFYTNMKEKYDLMEVIMNYGGFHNLLIDKSPHIPDDLKGKLIEIDQCILLFSSRMQMQLYYDALYPIHSRNKIYTEFHDEADVLYADIEKLIQQRSGRAVVDEDISQS